MFAHPAGDHGDGVNSFISLHNIGEIELMNHRGNGNHGAGAGTALPFLCRIAAKASSKLSEAPG